MSGYGEPEWLSQPTNTSANATQDANTGGNLTAPTASTTTSTGKGSCALMGLSILGLGLAAMMCSLGVLTLIEIHLHGLKKGADFSEPFLAAYMILFAVLLFMYELMWWMPMPFVNKVLRKNFGFMYGLRGKGLYLIFTGCLCLGLGDDASVKVLNVATGSFFVSAGILHWVIVCMYPKIALKYVAPMAGLVDESSPAVGENPV